MSIKTIVITFFILNCFLVQQCFSDSREEIPLNGAWETKITTDFTSVYGPKGSTPNEQWTKCNVPETFFSYKGEKRWLRRRINIPSGLQGKSIYLQCEAVKFNSTYFVNGENVGKHFCGHSQFELNITDKVRFGEENEILVGVCDWQGVFTKPIPNLPVTNDLESTIRMMPKNTILAPIGFHYYNYGIWGDIKIVALSPVHINDVTINTSVRKKTLEVIVEVKNDTKENINVKINCNIKEEPSVTFETKEIMVPAGEVKTVSFLEKWETPKLWDYENPNLYNLKISLSKGKEAIDENNTRFGFREFWVDGMYLCLNGKRMLARVAGDSPERTSGAIGKTKQESIKYLKSRKKLNANTYRPHGQPWRDHFYEAADEVGILIEAESAVWNDDWSYKLDTEEFWNNYKQELQGMYKKLKNHPSVVVWSMENEFNGPYMNDNTPEVKQKLIEIGQYMKKLDPTRPITYESDGDPGGVADIINLHYPYGELGALGEVGGREEAEIGGSGFSLYPNISYWLDKPVKIGNMFNDNKEFWQWDKKKPLWIGEYAWCPPRSPDMYALIIGDDAYTIKTYSDADPAIAKVWSFMTRVYRYFRINCSPWSVFEKSEEAFRVKAFAEQEAFRPLAAFCKEYNPRFYSGKKVTRTIHLMNDTLNSGPVRLSWKLIINDKVVVQGEKTHKMSPADLKVETIEINAPIVQERTKCILLIKAEMENTPTFEDKIECSIFPKIETYKPKNKIGVMSTNNNLVKFLDGIGIKSGLVDLNADINEGVVIMDKGFLKEDNKNINEEELSKRIDGFLKKGGRLLILGQGKQKYGKDIVGFEERGSTIVFSLYKNHPLVNGLNLDDFRFWSSDHIVCDYNIKKDTLGYKTILLTESPTVQKYSPLAEKEVAEGLIVVCGLNVMELYGKEPSADIMLNNMLKYLDGYKKDKRKIYLISNNDNFKKYMEEIGEIDEIKGTDKIATDNAKFVLSEGDVEIKDEIINYVKEGGLLWLHNPSKETFKVVAEITQPNTQLNMVDNKSIVVISKGENFLEGTTQGDLYWVSKKKGTDYYWAMSPLIQQSDFKISYAQKPSGIIVHSNPASIVTLEFGKGKIFVDLINWDKPEDMGSNVVKGKSFARALFSRFGGQLKYTLPKKIKSISQDKCFYIDLSKHTNQGFRNDSKEDEKFKGWTDQGQNDMRHFPIEKYKRRFAGIPFQIIDPALNNGKSCIVLKGMQRDYFPGRVEGIEVNNKLKKLCFLHTAAWCSQEILLGRYLINYEDGKREEIKIIGRKNISDWWHPSDLPEATVGWSGKNPASNQIVGVYVMEWDNPRVDVKIETIDFVSDESIAVPVLMAITGVLP